MQASEQISPHKIYGGIWAMKVNLDVIEFSAENG